MNSIARELGLEEIDRALILRRVERVIIGDSLVKVEAIRAVRK